MMEVKPASKTLCFTTNETIKEVQSICHCNLNTHFPHNIQSLTLTACNYKFWSAKIYRSAGSCRTHISIGHWNVYIACPAEHQNIVMRKEIAIRKILSQTVANVQPFSSISHNTLLTAHS